MSKILKYKDHVKMRNMGKVFMDSLSMNINESRADIDNETVEVILSDIINDMNINQGLLEKFKLNITDTIPVLKSLVDNSKIEFETTAENLVLLGLTVLSISNLYETDNKAGHGVLPCPSCSGKGCGECGDSGEVKAIIDKREAQSLLEELRMRGVGNVIVKKIVQCFVSIGKFTKTLLEKSDYSVSGLGDMLNDKSILLPIMNAMEKFIRDYDITIDTISNNLISLGSSVASHTSKKGFPWLVTKLSDVFGIENAELPETDNTDILISDPNEDDIEGNNLIKEQ